MRAEAWCAESRGRGRNLHTVTVLSIWRSREWVVVHQGPCPSIGRFWERVAESPSYRKAESSSQPSSHTFIIHWCYYMAQYAIPQHSSMVPDNYSNSNRS